MADRDMLAIIWIVCPIAFVIVHSLSDRKPTGLKMSQDEIKQFVKKYLDKYPPIR